ncbi:hypothetical protein FQN55_004600 [Onygenales sp. PD_40]|nr:hypothetical protein FQN55_004600 [Onygenales sp. PD_40]KAK2787420.1 hypothetical protein FQN53_005333 [Emmonsiellopsis sp. PD_33]KAK2794008.1 hypothetical protein FQN51_000981 [Onygenales sp. PD_10]
MSGRHTPPHSSSPHRRRGKLESEEGQRATLDSSTRSSSNATSKSSSLRQISNPSNGGNATATPFQTNLCPSESVLRKVARIPILDAEGKEQLFEDLYMPSRPGETKRVLVIFIRHFFCGSCQEYITALSSSIPSQSVLPPNTTIAIVGCGANSLIPMYEEVTKCPFPIYTDPTQRLYTLFGMTRTLNRGSYAPEYAQSSLASLVVKGITQGLKRMLAGDMLQSGDKQQNGGELLFEAEITDPVTSDMKGYNVKVPWCHLMENTRNHSEISVLKDVLGIGE